MMPFKLRRGNGLEPRDTQKALSPYGSGLRLSKNPLSRVVSEAPKGSGHAVRAVARQRATRRCAVKRAGKRKCSLRRLNSPVPKPSDDIRIARLSRSLSHRRFHCRLPARFALHLRVANRCAVVPTGHPLPSGAGRAGSLRLSRKQTRNSKKWRSPLF